MSDKETGATPPRAGVRAQHLGWVFSGVAEFEGRAGSFLAQGVARAEQVMLVSDDPRPELWPKSLVDRGALVLLSIAEVYGSEKLVDASAQRETFEQSLATAVWNGFAGLRVIADSTSLLQGHDRLVAWMRWEEQADRMMQVHPITGLCAFDRTRTDVQALNTVLAPHKLSPDWVKRQDVGAS